MTPGRPKLWVVVIYTILAVVCCGLIMIGLQTDSLTAKLGGVIGILVTAATAPVALLLAGMAGRLTHITLSDSAKRVLFRDRELHLIRRAIEDHLQRGDYDAAMTLCVDMADVFGCRQEAESYRSRIAQARAQQYELEVQSDLDQLDRALADRNWVVVHQQAARIRRLYPDSHLVGDLDRRIQQARQHHKEELETHFLNAVEHDDVESAMSLLKTLDRYLSRDEAGRLTEVAAGVIMRHRENLGHGFREAIGERRWADAARVGESIIAEFPNSKMATEVSSMIEVLRDKAAGAVVAAEEGGP